MTISAYSAYGTLLKRGDGAAGSAAKATRTWGTTDSQLVVTAKTAGTAGNSLTVTILSSGTAEATAVFVGSALTITVAATTGTVNDAIMAIYNTPATAALVDASNGVGKGTGVLAAASVLNLAGGTAGTEAFTTIDGVKGLSGPSFSLETIDVTHHTSASAYKQKLPTFLDGGDISFDLIYDPANAQHEALFTDFEGRLKRNFQVVYTDSGNMTHDFAAYVSSIEVSAPIDDALKLSVKLTIDGAITRTA
jgi:predicted secreted protein